ncbi:bifunctional diguanylate cyclase/phosphodiesterase [Jeotgalibacillus terrae]|uniref:EAL domain-containing protein n=1 Tax=Jeotgalibacillus terrae TaxID=587735 RepID=A0ABW5ZGN7_9BACL|nr:EAL domain-containing protein [Jeotgalibacillus terrae]MBM7579310.1 diguanylate cyclase (GGDEF)-like protein [Jeotgalibacillus terrae]
MKLQKQTLWVIGGSMFLFLILLTTFIRPMLLADALAMDEESMLRDMDRISNAIRLEQELLTSLNQDWAQWDEMYDFVLGENPDFTAANIDENTFMNNRIWRMMAINSDGEVLLDRSYGLKKEAELLTEQFYSLTPSLNNYLIGMNDSFFIVSVQRVLPTSGVGRSAGKLIIARDISSNYVKRLGYDLSLELDAAIINGSIEQNRVIRTVSEDRLEGQMAVRGSERNVNMLLTIDKPRSYYLSKRDVITKFVMSLVVLMTVIAIVLFIMLDRLMISRVTSLSKQLNQIRSKRDISARVQWKNHNGDEIHALGKSINGMLDSAEQSHREISDMAQHDQLTGMLNRYGIIDEFQRLKDSDDTTIAFLFFDLDGFKRINDSLGHKMGDALLKKVADRLSHFKSSESEVIARMGGDEFLMLMQTSDPDYLEERANEMIRVLKQNYILNDIKTFVTSSVGVANYPEDGTTFDEVLQAADIAMYEAKRKGKNQLVHYHDLAGDLDYKNILMLENDLKFALKNNELYLDYQPVYTGSKNRMIGVEALIRWDHPVKGRIPPNIFIPIAENGSFISDIGEWVLEQSIEQTVKWHKSGHKHIGVAVNVSKMQMKNKERFLRKLDDLLEKYQFSPEQLQIEITESDILFFDGEIVEFAAELRKKNVRVALDDFGVGTSTLFNLRNMPVNVVKIDRSFIKHVPAEEFDSKLLKGLYQVLEGIGMHIITEGVETAEQAAFIRSNSSSDIQGFYFGRPMKPEQIALLLEQEATWRQAASDYRG